MPSSHPNQTSTRPSTTARSEPEPEPEPELELELLALPLASPLALPEPETEPYKATSGAEEEAGSEAEAEEEGEAGEQPTLLLRRRAEEPLGPEALPEAGVRSLGLQAALHVLRSRRPLATLRDIAGNLPSLARPLSRLSLEDKHEEA